MGVRAVIGRIIVGNRPFAVAHLRDLVVIVVVRRNIGRRNIGSLNIGRLNIGRLNIGSLSVGSWELGGLNMRLRLLEAFGVAFSP
ncbi:hypothetical protein [Afifella sp. YEN Y35]|uniref:hypothetical protein n=1 Tax=Afifella sp. YEN Y35 TaxID=3388337 RepID=UPI0039E0142A